MIRLALALVLCSAGCATGPSQSAGKQFHDPSYRARPLMEGLLIKDEKALLPPDAFPKLLGSRIALPKESKAAVFSFPHQGIHGEDSSGYSYTRSIAFIEARRAYLEAVEEPLLETGRFREITHMPRFLVSGKPSLLRLREAAALMQADLLLITRTVCQLVTRHGIWFFSDDKVSVTCETEVVLLDVRTGVIPYAGTFEAMHVEWEASDDDSVVQTQQRAERVVTLKAIDRAVSGLSTFFAGP